MTKNKKNCFVFKPFVNLLETKKCLKVQASLLVVFYF